MTLGRFKSLLVAVFSVFSLLIFTPAHAGHGDADTAAKKEGFNATEVIFGHILDAHEFHFFDIIKKDGTKKPVTIPLPVILYSPQRGFTSFMSSRFHHGEHDHAGYRILTEANIAKMVAAGEADAKKDGLHPGKIIPVTTDGKWDRSVKVYDVSLTRNVVQMILALSILVWIMLVIAKRYRRGEGVNTAPKGVQNLIEPVITFVRDEVAKPNLGNKYEKYLPYILTVFFFILINNIFGLIPGTANVTGNIAFTVVLGLISFVVILFSSNKHYWGHIINPPGVPGWVKVILVPVEILSVFIKPFALIIRLFANMVAGHIIIICLISLIFIFAGLNVYAGWGTSVFSIAFTIFIYFIEILVAFIQAFIFSMLTAVFVGQAFETGHHGGDAHEHDDAVIV
ncbi:MAG: F0F1 ATP synthase subunit A [Chitinophagaceae bacterium]|nr:F0F1 ATP synthase subunit A [Chitinophagaceae bacterium]